MNGASVPPAWSAWANVTPVGITSARGGLTRTLIPMTISPDGDGRYADLRVIDERGAEQPFAIDPPEVTTNVRDVTLVDSAFVARRGSQAILDLGRRAAAVDRVVVSVDAEQHPTYFERLAVDASDDRRHWRTVCRSAIVYRVADDDGKGDQRVTFGRTRARWLRVRVLDPHEPFPLASASVALVREPRPPLVRLPLRPVATIDASAHRQVWTFAAPQPFRPSAVTFDGTSGSFVRPVRIEDSADGRDWTFAGDGTIASYGDGTKQISFGFPEDTAAAWRVVVENGDDVPLADAHPVLLAVPHELVFAATPGQTYGLLSGNPAARAASYDLGARLAHARWDATPAELGPMERNAAYHDPQLAWQRFAWVIAGLVAFALAISFAGLAVGQRPPSNAAPST